MFRSWCRLRPGLSTGPTPRMSPGVPPCNVAIARMMELFFRFDFAAARRLPQLPADHPCQRVHGHTFMIELTVRGDVGPNHYWIVDFDEIDRLTADLKGALDHRYLNDVPGLENPTTEMLAQWLWQRLASAVPGLYRIMAQEHPTRGVAYYGPQAAS